MSRKWIADSAKDMKILGDEIGELLEKNPHIRDVPSHALLIPTGELDKPLTSGKEVYEWLMKTSRNTARYSYRGRGRGSRKNGPIGWRGENTWNVSIPLAKSEKIALYVSESERHCKNMERKKILYNATQEISNALTNGTVEEIGLRVAHWQERLSKAGK